MEDSFPIQNGDMKNCYVSLPEGTCILVRYPIGSNTQNGMFTEIYDTNPTNIFG